MNMKPKRTLGFKFGTAAAASVVVAAMAVGTPVKPAQANVIDYAGAAATVAINYVAQIAQAAVQFVQYRNEPGNYDYWTSFWTMFFPAGVDKPLSAGSNNWGDYKLPSIPSQINRAAYFQWQKVTLPLSSGASCGNGSEYKFFVNLTNASNNVLIFQQGGGGCVDYGGCAGKKPLKNADGSWKYDAYGNVEEEVYGQIANPNGISDNFIDGLGNAFNGKTSDGLGWLYSPVLSRFAIMDPNRIKIQDWNVVVMPYCTGDTFIGDNKAHLVRVDGRQGMIQNFSGTKNVLNTLGWLRDNLPRPAQVFLTGQSAGSLSVDYHRATVRKILNPSDSLYTMPDAGFVMAEDPVNKDLAKFPATLFLSAAKKAWWNYPAANPADAPMAVNTAKEIAGFSATNVSNFPTLVSNKYPQDRVSYVAGQSDLNFPGYAYSPTPDFVAAAIETRDINLKAAPTHFSPLGNYIRNTWGNELTRLADRVKASGNPNLGYFFPSGRRLNESHTMTSLTFEGTTNQDTGNSTVQAMNNLIDRSRPPVLREKESDPTRGLYAPLGPSTQAAIVMGGPEILNPPLN
ncbi:MAG: hypothetical protein C4K60_19685 [Ideonella sp. MAG2]|nr:MAG: hypothetical protein C4K60_19685 [Ideonella sp. MAG2]